MVRRRFCRPLPLAKASCVGGTGLWRQYVDRPHARPELWILPVAQRRGHLHRGCDTSTVSAAHEAPEAPPVATPSPRAVASCVLATPWATATPWVAPIQRPIGSSDAMDLGGIVERGSLQELIHTPHRNDQRIDHNFGRAKMGRDLGAPRENNSLRSSSCALAHVRLPADWVRGHVSGLCTGLVEINIYIERTRLPTKQFAALLRLRTHLL